MFKIATILFKCTLYFVFGYIPFLMICVLVTTAIVALVIQSLDYCYGSIECLGHRFVIMIIGGIVGWEIATIVSVIFIDRRLNNRQGKTKRKRKEMRAG